MSSVVFILGAGASRQCGAPLMSDFLDVASDLLGSDKVNDKRAQFETVFSTISELQVVHSKAHLNLTNIESIFTVLELGRVIQRVPGLNREDIPLAIAALKELIVRTLEVTVPFPARRTIIGPPKPYEQFADLLNHLRSTAFPQQSVSVITFNYDIAVDMALYRGGMGPDYIVESPTAPHAPVKLMKLHGSLNWATDKATNQIRPIHLSDYFHKFSIHGYEERSQAIIPIGSQLSEYFLRHHGIEVHEEPVIVPPSWNKADYHNALSDVWAAAAQNLSEAEYIFVIGYSLPETDSFFRHLYALGSVGKAVLRKILVFNPDASGDVDRRFRNLLGPGATARYNYRPLSFESAIEEIKGFFPKRS